MQETKYMALANKLREEIVSYYADAQRFSSENQLCAQTGYSRQTVRQAIAVLESEGLLVRVRGSGTYVQKSKIKRSKTHNIAIVTTYIEEYIFPAILSGIETVLSQNGYTSMIFATKNRVDNEREILKTLLDKPIDGIIVEGTKTALPNPNIYLYAQIEKAGIPIVFINGFYPELASHVHVVADDRQGGRLACEMLIKKGHKCIAGIFKADDIQGHKRYAGYAQALNAAGMCPKDDLVLWYSTENRDSIISSAAQQIAQNCTAVVCYNDEAAMLFIKACQSAAIEIISFDNSPLAQLASSFYSLKSPKENIGTKAAQKLLGLIDYKTESSVTLPWEE